MRIAYLLFLVPATLSGGCAGLIAGAGTDPTEFKTKEEVHANFGEPCASGSVEGTLEKDQHTPRDAAFYEDYMTRRKIADRSFSDSMGAYGLCFISTLGTIELLLVPQQLYLMTKRTIAGQTLRIIYDANGKVVGGQLDGEEIIHFHP